MRGAVAHAGQPAQFAADQESVDAAGRGGELRVVQDHAAKAPIGAAAPGDGGAAHREVRCGRAAEEGVHLRRGGGGLVGRTGDARRRRTGDAAAPGKGGLAGRAAIGVGQRVARRDIHEQEGAEHDAKPARFQVLDGADDRGVGWRAAIGGNAAELAHHMGRAARDAVHAPGLGIGRLRRGLDAGLDRAGAGAQIAREPAGDQRYRAEIWRQRRQFVERGVDVGGAGGIVRVLRHGAAFAVVFGDDRSVVVELAGAGDQRHAGQTAFERARIGERAKDLEGKLRDAVAEIGELQILEHDIGEIAEGRRVIGAFDVGDQRIGRLRRAAGMKARRDLRQVEQIAVGPHPADPRHRSAEPDREGDRIGVVGLADRGRADALAAAAGRGGRGLLVAAGPDDLARQPHAAIEAGDRRAFGRGLERGVGQARTIGVAAGRDGRVDLASGQRAQRAAELRAGHAEKGEAAEQRPAQRRAGDAEDKRSHVFASSLFPLGRGLLSNYSRKA